MAAGISLVEEEESPLNSSINTTPLVDVMLVMLIIFLVTIPVVVTQFKVALPVEKNVAVVSKPENINLSVSSDGDIYWNTVRVDEAELGRRLAIEAPKEPQPEVHIKGDLNTEYHNVGRVVQAAQKAGILKIGFITKVPPRG